MEARWVALAVLTAARVSMAFQFQSFASAAPLLVRDLGIGYADAGFLIGLYMLPGIVLSFPGGLLGRRFGDKRMVVVGRAEMSGVARVLQRGCRWFSETPGSNSSAFERKRLSSGDVFALL